MTSNVTLTPELLAAGLRLFEQPWRFVKGVVDLGELPREARAEFAFAGRSNVGKSSLINALVRQKGLAHTSSTPGRTQELNVFAPPDSALFIVDLPGYGFARAPKDKVAAWTRLVRAYLGGRAALRRVFLLIDSRHGVKPPDREIMDLLDAAAVSYQVVLTKADDSSADGVRAIKSAVEAELSRRPAAYPQVLATSARKGLGLEELRATIAGLLDG